MLAKFSVTSKSFYSILVSAILVVGCEDNGLDRVPVSGKVRIDGKPLAMGTIRFVPASGRPASAKLSEDGSFQLVSETVNTVRHDGIPKGKYRVQVASSEVVDDQTIRWHAPEKFADFRTSGIEVEIREPTNSLLIELTSEENDDRDAITTTAGEERGLEAEGHDDTATTELGRLTPNDSIVTDASTDADNTR